MSGTYRVTPRIDVALGAGYIWVKPFDNRDTGGQIRGLTSSPPASSGPPYSLCLEAPAGLSHVRGREHGRAEDALHHGVARDTIRF